MDIKLEIIKPNKKKYDITKAVESVTWSGDYKQSARTLDFAMIGSTINEGMQAFDIPLGSTVVFYEKSKELFRGMIFRRDVGGESFRYTSHDDGVRLLKIKGYYNFKDKSVADICNQICTDYKIPKGTFASVSTKITKIFIGTSLYDIIMSCYTEASKANGKKYMCCFRGGKVHVIEKGTETLKLSFEECKNILSNNFTESVENMVNKIVVVDNEGNKKEHYYKQNQIDLYGLFQEVITYNEDKDMKVEAESKYKDIEQTASLNGYGDTSCVTGYGVTVKDSNTKMLGLFHIESDRHTWSKGTYSINLRLNFKNMMHEVDSGKDEQETEESKGSTSVSGGKEVKAEFTAYYPANNSLQGGYMDAMGNRLDPSKLTCAAPKNVAFKTKIQVKDTGTDRDNLVYTVTDRGGAIVVDKNGVYHIDLLMSNKKEAYAFGRRKGTAIIGVSVNNNTSSSSSSSSSSNNSSSSSSSKPAGNDNTRSRVVTLAKKQVGKKYVWGATGPTSFDCSGFTQWCYKMIDYKIPRTSGDQSKYGTLVTSTIAVNKLKPGDLLFFATGKSPSAVSHVGMYIGGGQMVHAANSNRGVVIDSVTSTYYTRTFVRARRVI